jgi:hypothetical protein
MRKAHAAVMLSLALAACNQSTSMQSASFFDPGTEAALLVAGTAASYDPTGAASVAVIHAYRTAATAKAEQTRADWKRYIAEEEALADKLPDPQMRAQRKAILAQMAATMTDR